MTPAPRLRQATLLSWEHWEILSSVPMQSTLLINNGAPPRPTAVSIAITLPSTCWIIMQSKPCSWKKQSPGQLAFYIVPQLATYHLSIIDVPEVMAHQTPSTWTTIFHSTFILHVSSKLNQPHISVIAFYKRINALVSCNAVHLYNIQLYLWYWCKMLQHHLNGYNTLQQVHVHIDQD